jgi:hypothetical protein
MAAAVVVDSVAAGVVVDVFDWAPLAVAFVASGVVVATVNAAEVVVVVVVAPSPGQFPSA